MKHPFVKLFAGLTLSMFVFFSCAKEPGANNQLSAREKSEGWALLFDGKTTNQWHLYNKGPVPSAWLVQNGELYCKPNTPELTHGDLVTDKEFENFDFQFEWKISPGGNSGVFINVLERSDLATTWASGPEYQLLERTHPDYAANEKKRAGCMFGLVAQKTPVDPKPAGEWNQSRIRQMNGKVEFYLNGVLTVEQDLDSPQWFDMIGGSGFKSASEFGRHTKGHIAFQDWAKGISFRNVKIREL